jgi:hypothetical protein
MNGSRAPIRRHRRAAVGTARADRAAEAGFRGGDLFGTAGIAV